MYSAVFALSVETGNVLYSAVLPVDWACNVFCSICFICRDRESIVFYSITLSVESFSAVLPNM